MKSRESIILKLLQMAARPTGASAREMRDCFKAKDRDVVADIRDKLLKTGELVVRSHTFPGARKPQIRYARTAQQLEAWVSSGAIKPVRRPSRTIADVLASAPVVASVVRSDVVPAHRYAFTGTPGRHVDSSECRPWAKAATA